MSGDDIQRDEAVTMIFTPMGEVEIDSGTAARMVRRKDGDFDWRYRVNREVYADAVRRAEQAWA